MTFLTRWTDRLRASGTTVSFYEGIVEQLAQLRRVIPDNHLTFDGAEQYLGHDSRLIYQEYRAALPDAANIPEFGAVKLMPGIAPSTVRTAPLLLASGRLMRVLVASATGNQEQLRIVLDGPELVISRAPQVRRPRVQPPQIPAYEWRAVGNISVITLRSFADLSTLREQLESFVTDFTQHIQSSRILFDLRNNDGGNLRYIRAWVNNVVRGTWQSYPQMERTEHLWPCSLWNHLVAVQAREGNLDSEYARGEREHVRQGWQMEDRSPAELRYDGVEEGRAAEPYRGNVFVLVNRHTGSSGELAAWTLRRALNATVIGERTAGGCQYGEQRTFVLPCTKLVCRIPTKRFQFDDCVESIGFANDVYLERMDEPAEALVPHLDAIQLAVNAR